MRVRCFSVLIETGSRTLGMQAGIQLRLVTNGATEVEKMNYFIFMFQFNQVSIHSMDVYFLF